MRARAFALLACAVIAPAIAAPTKEQTLDAMFADYDLPGQPGLAVGIYQGGKQVYANGYGYADLESDVPIGPQTVFHIASVSKQFVAFAAVLLEKEGRLNLDGDVRAYLPYVPDFGRQITSRHLLYHTSGLRDQWSLFLLAGRDFADRLRQSQVINMVKRQRTLNFAPGSDFLYCNTGYTLLAELVASVSGQRLRELTDTRIFRPLGMSRTFFYDDVTEIVPHRAHSYEMRNGKWHRSILSYDTVGATSLHTTVSDLLRWASNFSKPVVGDAALIREFTQMGRLDDGTSIDYGFGLMSGTFSGHAALWHSGDDAAFRSLFAYFPEQDFAVALLANTPMSLESALVKIAAVYLGNGRSSDTESVSDIPASVPSTREQVRTLPGLYSHPYKTSMTFVESSSGVVMKVRNGEPRSLTFRADGTFDFGDAQRRAKRYFRPIHDDRGRVAAIESRGPSVVERAATRFQRVEPATRGASALRELEGSYRSAELDVTYELRLQGGSLVMDSIWLPDPIELIATAIDRFDGASFIKTVAVERNARGKPAALLVSNNWMHAVRLDRVR